MTSTPPIAFSGDIPRHYDEHLGPLFFERYAEDLASRVEVPEDGRLLEVACGTGIVTRRLRESIPERAEIVATDLNDAMVSYARERNESLPNVRFEQANALDLPYNDASFDALACQFGLMFFEDKLAGMREALRVLRPGGQVVMSVWDSMEQNRIAAITHRTISKFFDEDPPRFMEVPFGYYDLDVIRGLLEDAGFRKISLRVVPAEVERPCARTTAIGLVKGNPTITEVDARGTADADAVVAAVGDAIAAELGDAPMRVKLRAIVVEATK